MNVLGCEKRATQPTRLPPVIFMVSASNKSAVYQKYNFTLPSVIAVFDDSKTPKSCKP